MPQTPHPWDKLREKGAASMPRRYHQMPLYWKICVDLFTYYHVGDGRLAHAAARARFLIAASVLDGLKRRQKPGESDAF